LGQTQLFFTEYRFNDPKIRGINLDGTNLHELFPLAPAEWLPVGIAYDFAAGKVYWTNGNFTAGTIRRANLDGSQNELLLSGLRNPRGLAVDAVHGKLYWADANAPDNLQVFLKRANLDGTNEETIFTGSIYVGQPRVDATNQRVYFGADGEIKSAALDGTDVRTAVTGVSLPGAVDVDIDNGYIYWIDFDTHTDFVGRARLDNTEFTVLVDISPSVVQSSGLVDIILDRTHGHFFFANQVFVPASTTIERANLDGTNHIVFYPGDPNYTPSAMALDVTPSQPVADCDNDGVPDATEIAMGEPDCNMNLIPDACEVNPCPVLNFLLDNGSNAASTQGFALGVPSEWEQFQPFDVPPGGWAVGQFGVDGYTVNYIDGSGFNATLYPDNGSNLPDLNAPIATASGYNLRFDTNHANWVYRPVTAALPEGRHWVRLHANMPASYLASINRGTSGPGAFSRGSSGNFVPSAFSLAVRIVEQTCAGHTGDINADGLADGRDVSPFVAAVLAGSTGPADLCAVDFSESGVVDFADVAGFAAALVGGP